MAYSLLVHGAAGSVNAGLSVVVGPLDTSGADLIVLGASWYGFASSPGTFTESTGLNTVTLRTPYYDSVLAGAQLAFYTNVTTSAAHTFTLTSAGTYMSLYVAAFSGSKLSGVYDTQNGSAPGSAGTSLQPGSVSPSEANELLVSVAAITDDGAGFAPLTIDSSFTITDTVASVHGNNIGGGFAYLIQGAASAINPTWSWSGSYLPAAAIATFKAAAAAVSLEWTNSNERPSHYNVRTMIDSGPTPGRGI